MLALAWNAWWIADTMGRGNLLDSTKPLGIPVPLGDMIAAAFWAFLGFLAALNGLYWRYDGSRRGKAVLVGAVGYALLGLVVFRPWIPWHFESFNLVRGL